MLMTSQSSTALTALALALVCLAGCGNLTEHGIPERVTYAPDGSLMLSLNGATQFLDGEGRAITRSVATTPAGGVLYIPGSRICSLSPDGTRFAAPASGAVTVYDSASGRAISSLTFDDGDGTSPTVVAAIALDRAGARLAVVTAPTRLSAAPGHLRVFDVDAQAQLLDVPHDPARAASATWPGGVALSLDGGTVYGAETSRPTGATPAGCFLDAWNVGNGTRIWDAAVPLAADATFNTTFTLTLSPDGTLLAGGSWDTAALYVWHTSDGSTASTLSDATTGLSLGIPDAFKDIRFSPDASQILVAFPGAPLLFGIDATYVREFVPDTNTAGGVISAALSPDGNRVASVFNSSLEVWNTTDASVITLRDLKGQLD
jgi:WD40 repeat protein